MKIAIISSSLNPMSQSRKMCEIVRGHLSNTDAEIIYVDLRDYDLGHTFGEEKQDREKLKTLLQDSDAYIFGMAVYNYSMNDSLKSMFDVAFPGEEHKLFGVVCSAGSAVSFLTAQQVAQTCMNEWHMIPFPHTLFVTGRDFDEEKNVTNEKILQRAEVFSNKFYDIARRLAFKE